MRYSPSLAIAVAVMVNLFEGLPSLAAPPPPLSETARSYGLTAEEVQAAFGTEALNSLTRGLSGSECHSGITRRIQLSCGRTNSAEVSAMTEQDKKGLAISLTLCSMESALQPIPTECLRWSPHEASPTEHRPTRQDWFKEQAPREEQQQQALCLSAQDWSSYNVYLSDAKLAQTRYFNATQEKLAFISLLKKREEKETERHGAEVASLKRRLTDLHKLSELVYDSMRAVKSDIELNKQLSEDVQTAFSSFELARGTEWDRVETAIQEKLLRLTDHFQGISDDFQATWIPKMSARLETVLTSHEMALVDRNEETGRVMQNWMRHVEDQVNTFAVSTSNDMERLHSRWEEGLAVIRMANDYLANLGGGFQRLEMALGSSLNATAHLTVAQAEMAEIIQVTTRKTELLFGSQERLESSINRTIDALNPRGVRSAWSWIQPVSVMSGPSLFAFPFSGSSPRVVFQIVLGLFQLVWQLTCLSLSVLGCVSILYRRRLKAPLAGGIDHWSTGSQDDGHSFPPRLANYNDKIGSFPTAVPLPNFGVPTFPGDRQPKDARRSRRSVTAPP